MTGNPLPWIALLGVVVVTLLYKGYVKLPSAPARGHGHHTPPQSSSSVLGSQDLGILFAQAMRREAEEEMARQFAREAGDQIKSTFTAPFLPPAPAGQAPSQPGNPPTP